MRNRDTIARDVAMSFSAPYFFVAAFIFCIAGIRTCNGYLENKNNHISGILIEKDTQTRWKHPEYWFKVRQIRTDLINGTDTLDWNFEVEDWYYKEEKTGNEVCFYLQDSQLDIPCKYCYDCDYF